MTSRVLRGDTLNNHEFLFSELRKRRDKPFYINQHQLNLEREELIEEQLAAKRAASSSSALSKKVPLIKKITSRVSNGINGISSMILKKKETRFNTPPLTPNTSPSSGGYKTRKYKSPKKPKKATILAKKPKKATILAKKPKKATILAKKPKKVNKVKKLIKNKAKV
jgi:hypothetical protein